MSLYLVKQRKLLMKSQEMHRVRFHDIITGFTGFSALLSTEKVAWNIDTLCYNSGSKWSLIGTIYDSLFLIL